MKTNTEFVLGIDGNIIRRVTVENPVIAGGDVVSRLSSKSTVVVPRIFTVHGSVCHAKFYPDGRVYATVEIEYLRLKTHFLLKDDRMIPQFPPPSRGDEHPDWLLMTPEWKPLAGMRLRFMVRVNRRDNSYAAAQDGCYIVAIDNENRHYRLPLPNIHDDLHACMGEFDPNGSDLRLAVDTAVSQFFMSPWGNHLIKNLKQSQDMFTFVAKTGGKPEQIEFTGDWTAACIKVGTSELTENLIL